MNKKGQIDNPIIAFIIIAITLLIMGPVMLKSYNAIYNGISPKLHNLTGGANVSGTNFDAVMTPLINFWDMVIVAAFVLSIILLLISSFLIDTHPLWIILYILIVFLLIVFLPSLMQSVNTIYDSAQYSTEVAQLTYLDFIRNHMGELLVGLIIITGIIIYGKVRLFPSSEAPR